MRGWVRIRQEENLCRLDCRRFTLWAKNFRLYDYIVQALLTARTRLMSLAAWKRGPSRQIGLMIYAYTVKCPQKLPCNVQARNIAALLRAKPIWIWTLYLNLLPGKCPQARLQRKRLAVESSSSAELDPKHKHPLIDFFLCLCILVVLKWKARVIYPKLFQESSRQRRFHEQQACQQYIRVLWLVALFRASIGFAAWPCATTRRA